MGWFKPTHTRIIIYQGLVKISIGLALKFFSPTVLGFFFLDGSVLLGDKMNCSVGFVSCFLRV